MALSVDAPDVSAEFCRKAGFTFTFLSDPNAEVIRRSRHEPEQFALLLREAQYPPVLYIPRADADMALLERTNHSTYCPYKGDCSYYSIPIGGSKSINAVWTYEDPYAAVAQIKGHLAFYRDRVDSIRP